MALGGWEGGWLWADGKLGGHWTEGWPSAVEQLPKHIFQNVSLLNNFKSYLDMASVKNIKRC